MGSGLVSVVKSGIGRDFGYQSFAELITPPAPLSEKKIYLLPSSNFIIGTKLVVLAECTRCARAYMSKHMPGTLAQSSALSVHGSYCTSYTKVGSG